MHLGLVYKWKTRTQMYVFIYALCINHEGYSFLFAFKNNYWMFQAKGAGIGDVFLASECAFHDRRIPIPVSVPYSYHFVFLMFSEGDQ